ncbi:kinesin motor protein cin8, partial [Tulasnella sp. 403]
MGLANNANTNALKIFDEAGGGKRGVLIQGLEEVSCKDANHAIAILRKGSLRRQIAATKFNDHSSRSHSIFMVTVHTKETNSKGDDTLRVGKLNLVDLAGSENIGRSGAENKRAREAGMINQSLLTLGRVINALVDGSPHIPYRESKLTRLLQDSLGGRTKTCIIATVSPARCNMEETLSTLDYALRAKSIRNKPEVNQRMTRNSLLKEYVVEIEKLKSDLLAAREKNGIWFSKESWAEMSDEKEQMRTLYEESRRQVEIIQSQMRAVREEFESAMGLLTRSENELRGAKERLEKTEGSLRETEREREGLKGMLEEEVVVREAHELAERRLDEVARSLREVATEGVKDVGGLFNKLDRKTAVFSSNAKAVVKHSTALDIRTLQLQETLQEFAKDHRLTTQELVSMADRIRAHELEVLAQHSAAISKQLASLDQAIPGIRTKEAAETEATTAMSQVVRKATDGIMTSLSQWETQVKQNCDALVEEVGRGCLAQMDVAAHVLGSAITLVRDVVRESKEFVESERKTMEEILQLSVDASQAEISRLTNQNTLLTRLLDSEK